MSTSFRANYELWRVVMFSEATESLLAQSGFPLYFGHCARKRIEKLLILF